jgi:hypothetical protein
MNIASRNATTQDVNADNRDQAPENLDQAQIIAFPKPRQLSRDKEQCNADKWKWKFQVLRQVTLDKAIAKALKRGRVEKPAEDWQPLPQLCNAIALLLADLYMAKHGCALAYQYELARDCGVEVRQLQTALALMQERGLLRKEGRGGRAETGRGLACRYVLLLVPTTAQEIA